MIDISQKLVEKSEEAFILGIEICNKPTIRYRIEGFSFFITNAWELMLKAKLLNDGKNVYMKDNPLRTISLSQAIALVYTDKHQPLRINLEKIITLRNTSTHFITDDYETIYAPLFQANVLSFCEQIQRFHNVDISKKLSISFLNLTASIEPLTNEQIKIKYTPEVANRLIFQKNDIETTTSLLNTDKFAIPIKHNLYQVKSKNSADFTFKLTSDADESIQTITKYKNPSETHKFTYKNLIMDVNQRLKKLKIDFGYESGGKTRSEFNSYTLQLFIEFYDMKHNEKYAYTHMIGDRLQWTYSQQSAEFIVDEVRKYPSDIISKLKKAKEQEKR